MVNWTLPAPLRPPCLAAELQSSRLGLFKCGGAVLVMFRSWCEHLYGGIAEVRGPGEEVVSRTCSGSVSSCTFNSATRTISVQQEPLSIFHPALFEFYMRWNRWQISFKYFCNGKNTSLLDLIGIKTQYKGLFLCTKWECLGLNPPGLVSKQLMVIQFKLWHVPCSFTHT